MRIPCVSGSTGDPGEELFSDVTAHARSASRGTPMMLRAVGRTLLLLAALFAAACGESPGTPSSASTPDTPRTTRQEVRSTNKVLILGSSVSGGLNSREAQAVHAFAPTRADRRGDAGAVERDDGQQFMAYRASSSATRRARAAPPRSRRRSTTATSGAPSSTETSPSSPRTPPPTARRSSSRTASTSCSTPCRT